MNSLSEKIKLVLEMELLCVEAREQKRSASSPGYHAVLLQFSDRSRRQKYPEVARERRQQVQPGQPPAEVHVRPRFLLAQLQAPHSPERPQEKPQPGLNLFYWL